MPARSRGPAAGPKAKAQKKRANAARKQAKGRAREQARDGAAPLGRQGVESRASLFEELQEHTPYVGVTTPEGAFVVSTEDAHIGRGLFAKAQRPETGVLKRSVTIVRGLSGPEAIEKSVFVDIGANIGTTTVPALASQGFDSALACEPEEHNFRLLRANLCLNGVEDRARTLRVALSNEVGRSKLVMVEGAGGNGWLAVDPQRIQDAEAERAAKAAGMGVPVDELPKMTTVEVELTTVNQLVEGAVIAGDRVGMLWVDAEGHEGHVLEGAGSLAERGVPTVFEFHPAGLDARGDRGKIHDVASSCYTHFVDVRRPATQARRPGLRLQPVDELPDYADRFLSESTPAIFTDLLLLRLSPAQVDAGAKLQKLVARRQRRAQQGSAQKARRRAS